jgi:tRNA dimethylallyltransferase
MKEGIFEEKGEKLITREELEKQVLKEGLKNKWQELRRIDPDYAEKIGPNDKIRIIRAFEIFYNTGCIPSKIHKMNVTPFTQYQFIRIGLRIERTELYRRIENRIDQMLTGGLVEEIEYLLKKYPRDCPPFRAIGYKEMLYYLEGRISFKDAVVLLKKNSRNFAKRQLTWFRNERDIAWFDPKDTSGIFDFIRLQGG